MPALNLRTTSVIEAFVAVICIIVRSVLGVQDTTTTDLKMSIPTQTITNRETITTARAFLVLNL